MFPTLRRLLFGWICPVLALIAMTSHGSAASADGKEIAEIQVIGNQIHSTDEILSRMVLRPGRAFSIDDAQKDVCLLIAQGWFEPSGVQLFPLDRPDGRLNIKLKVQELPNLIQKITYLGADHIGTEAIEKITCLKKGQPLSPAKNQQARNQIIRHYHEKGRFWATVKLTKGNRVEDEEVIFDVAEGPIVKVSSVKFKFFGPTSDEVGTSRLRKQIQSSEAILGIIGGDFDVFQLDRDIIKLKDYYNHTGYLTAKVQRELVWSEDHQSVTVVFHIEEGHRFKVRKLDIKGSQLVSELKLLSYTNLRPGDFYDQLVVDEDLKRLRDYYGYQGRPTIVREMCAQVGTDGVDVCYEVEEREPVRVSNIVILGNALQDNVVERTARIWW